MHTKIKQFRTQFQLTQQQLADLVEVSSRTIISIEKGHYNPSLMLAYKLSNVFGVTIEELCCLQDNLIMEERNGEDLQ